MPHHLLHTERGTENQTKEKTMTELESTLEAFPTTQHFPLFYNYYYWNF